MKKLVFSFLVDFGYQKSVDQSIPLIKSIRNLGGSLKDSDILLCYVGDMSHGYYDKISTVKNLKFKKVEPFHKEHKHSNKLRIIEQPEINGYEYLCLLDCDTLILNDIERYLVPNKISAKIADGKTVGTAMFKKLFRLEDRPYPEESYKTTNGFNTIIYCNAGVIIFDTKMGDFFKLWSKKTKWLCDNIHLLGKDKFFCEQVTFSLVMYEFGSHFYNQLPLEMNFPTHINLRPNNVPKIIHYHNQIKDGVVKTPYTLINEKISYL